MKSLSVLLVLLLSVAAFCADKPEQVATESANHWLGMIDGGEYAKSWDAAAPAFKKAVSKAQWTNTLQANREPLENCSPARSNPPCTAPAYLVRRMASTS